MSDPEQGEIRFFDNYLPPLAARDYLLELTQTVELPEQVVPDYAERRRLRVMGPHFALDPQEIGAVFPAANSQAPYGDVLPNLVFTRRGLPWLITPEGPGGAGPTRPWLALLLLTPEEILLPAGTDDGGNVCRTQVRPLADYLWPSDQVVGPAFSEAEKRAFQEEYPDLTVTVIDLEAQAFSDTAPTWDELPYLAHLRLTDDEDQELRPGGEDGWSAAVIANRFPVGSKSGAYLCHLVSLEGFAGYLPGGSGLPPQTRAVRLLSLHAWAFNSLEGGADFAALMAGLDLGPLRMPDLIPEPATDPEREVARALAAGYTAFRYETRLGEPTTAWYRGPCLPVPMERNMQPIYPAAEAALIYDWDVQRQESTGLFDVSFAAAWQIGRASALADRQFMTSLFAWIREHNSLAQLLAERIALFSRQPGLAAPAATRALLAPDLLRRLGRELLARAWAPLLTSPDPRATQDAPPLVARPRPLLGPARDPSGIRAALARYPGVVSPADFLGGLASRWSTP